MPDPDYLRLVSGEFLDRNARRRLHTDAGLGELPAQKDVRLLDRMKALGQRCGPAPKDRATFGFRMRIDA